MLIDPKIQKAIDLRAKEGDLEKVKNELLNLLSDKDIMLDSRQKSILLVSLSVMERDLGNTSKSYQYLAEAEKENVDAVLKVEIASLRGYLDLKTGVYPNKIIQDIEQVLKETKLDDEDEKEGVKS